MANRQIARDIGVSPKTVDDQLSRLGRHCMLYHRQQMLRMPPPRTVAIDGLETFEHSQYFPFHFNICVEKDTDFFLSFTDSELRRKGRMTARQRAKRATLEACLGRPDPRAVPKGITALLRDALRDAPDATIHSDDHPLYAPAIRGLSGAVTHRVTPGRAHRGVHNPLFPVNLVDLLIRHCQANHKRETIAFAKRRAAAAERLVIFLVWRNYIKGRREKHRESPTPAMAMGLSMEPLTINGLLARRLFYDHIPLPKRWRLYYTRQIWTRALRNQRTHQLTYAF